jgi:hypothetical protein
MYPCTCLVAVEMYYGTRRDTPMPERSSRWMDGWMDGWMGGDTTTTMTGGQEVHARTHAPPPKARAGWGRQKQNRVRPAAGFSSGGFRFCPGLDPGRADEESSCRWISSTQSQPHRMYCSMCSCVHRRHHTLVACHRPSLRPAPPHVSPAPLMRMHCTRHCPLPASSLGSPIKLSPAGPAGAQTHSHTVTLLMRLTVPVPPAEPTHPPLQPTPANPASRPRRLPVPP